MQPFKLASTVTDDYARYIRTSFPVLDKELWKQFDHKIRSESLLWRGPYISLTRKFKPGPQLDALVSEGILHQKVADIFRPQFSTVFAHQDSSLRRLREGKHTIVATGTGSGKTEAFLLPILDYIVRNPGEKGSKALIIYPMNALANDQLNRLRARLSHTGITFARYTGDTPYTDDDMKKPKPTLLSPGEQWTKDCGKIPPEEKWSRRAIREEPPDILITNYSMLEYLLVRNEDQKIFRPHGKPSVLRYLVLDEIHTYVGALGCEIACLIRRLKEHTGRCGGGLICIGTSATVQGTNGSGSGSPDSDTEEGVLRFASELFAEEFDNDGLVGEEYVPRKIEGQPYHPDVPIINESHISDFPSMLKQNGEATDITSEAGAMITQLAQDLTGRELVTTGDIGRGLYGLLENNEVIRWLEESLPDPTDFSELAEAFANTPQRKGRIDERFALLELSAYFLLGTTARKDGQALLRPKLHLFYRGLSNFTRCVNPECGSILDNGQDQCPECGSYALPLEVCRTCGQDYLRGEVAHEIVEPPKGKKPVVLPSDFQVLSRIEGGLPESNPHTIHVARKLHPLPTDYGDEEEIDEDELDEEYELSDLTNGEDRKFRQIWICNACGHAYLNQVTNCAQENCSGGVTEYVLVKQYKLLKCPTCGGTYYPKEVATLLWTSTAASISTLTSILMSNLPLQDERKLLVFADNRQDTAYQAGYLQDTVQQYSWRQLILSALDEREQQSNGSIDMSALRDIVYQKGTSPEIQVIPRENEQQWKDRLEWDILEEFTRSPRVRNTLEALGLVKIKYTHFNILEGREKFRSICSEYNLSSEELKAAITNLLNEMRMRRALDHQLLSRYLSSRSVNGMFQSRITRYNRKPVGYRDSSAPKARYFNIYGYISAGGAKTIFQSFAERLGVHNPNEFLRQCFDLMAEDRLIVENEMGGSLAGDRAKAYQVNHGRVQITLPEALWRCRSCGRIYSQSARNTCFTRSCAANTLEPNITPDESNFYVSVYRKYKPVKIATREHSGQISSTKREDYENDFSEGRINVLVCTPTMELGVNIGQLVTVMMRNVPPSPSNYAQRAGRAGREDRVALINVYTQPGPHDSYFYGHPTEMIRGAIRTPIFRLNNEYIIRRHIHSLILEKLDHQLPNILGSILDDSGLKLAGHIPVIENVEQKRREVMDAVLEAFARDKTKDIAGLEWLNGNYIADLIEQFPNRLESALKVWLNQRNQIIEELEKFPKYGLRPDQRSLREWLEQKLYRITEDRTEAYTLRFLAHQGFLPIYAFPGDVSSLTVDRSDLADLYRDRLLALEEYAPGNIVYVDGKKVLVTGLDFRKGGQISEEGFAKNTDYKYYRCASCSYVQVAGTIQDCPQCKKTGTMRERSHLPGVNFRGIAPESITAQEEARSRKWYQVEQYIVNMKNQWTRYRFDEVTLDFVRDQDLFFVNTGFREFSTAIQEPQSFRICLRCGLWFDPSRQSLKDWESEHRKKIQCGGSHHLVDLSYQMKSDVLIMTPANPSSDAGYFPTLRNSLLAGARIMLEADSGEIGGFDRIALSESGSSVTQIVLYESVPGGAGYLERLAKEIPEVARITAEMLDHPDCETSCYGCIRTYYNQREHDLLDKRLVLEFFRNLSSQKTQSPEIIDIEAAQPTFNDYLKTESPIEEILLQGIAEAGIPSPTPQYEVIDSDEVITRADFAYVDEKILIFCDGKEYHSTPEQRESDIEKRSRCRKLGYKVLAFPGGRIFYHLGDCIEEIKEVLANI